MNIKQKTSYIGVDIGSASIKAVELEFGLAGDAVLRKANIVARSAGVKKALSGMQPRTAKVIGMVDCPTTCLRHFTVPKMPPKELDEAIKWEAKEKLAYPLEEALTDYEVQEEFEEGGAKKLRIIFAASPKKFVDNVTALLGEAEIEPISIIEPPLAIESLARTIVGSGSGAVSVVDVGSEFTSINIVKDGALRFHRKINSGGMAITKAVTAVLVSEQGKIELGFDEAEKLKKKYGIPAEADSRLLDDKLTNQQFISLIRPAVERLIQEIERSFEYYSEAWAGDRVNSVILVGGGAALKGLSQFLNDGLDIPVSVGDPTKGLTVAKGAEIPAEDLPVFANAVGAALNQGRGINLLPPEIRQKTVRSFEKAAVEGIVAVAVGAVVVVFALMQLRLATLDKKIRYGGKELSAASPQMEISLHYERLNDEIKKRQAFMDEALKNEPPVKEILKELSNRLPHDASLGSLLIKDGKAVINGEISAETKDKGETLSKIISSLEGGLFDKAVLVNAKMNDTAKSEAEFEIRCEF